MHLMQMEELTWRPEGKGSARETEKKQCSPEEEKTQVCRVWKKGLLDITQGENS